MVPTKEKPIVLHLVTQAEFGGAQKYVFDIAQGLSDSYTFVVGAGELHNSEELLTRLKHIGVYTLRLTNVIRAISPLSDLRGLFQITRCIVKIKPALIHLHTSKMSILGSLAARLAMLYLGSTGRSYRPKIVYTAHGWVFREKISWLKRQFYMRAEQFTGRFKHAIVCLSQADNLLARSLHIGNPLKLYVIANGVSIDAHKMIQKTEARLNIARILRSKYSLPDFHTSSKELWVGTVANLYENKGLDVLISAMHSLHQSLQSVGYDVPVCAFIIGEGKLESKLHREIETLGLENVVYLTGVIKDAWRYLHAFDIFVLPSHKEGFPFALLEAMAAGLPVVATRVGAIPEIITHQKDGILIDVGDSATLGNELSELIHHSEIRNRIAKSGQQLVTKHYTNELFLRHLHHLYKIMLAN